ncbi:MAG TPA: trypsin-like peptidase domain-containing protein [Myxococcaceae bacterium]|nr:trypsin-like peptidase domain-containing protein [Myxococcaceae bacterium]
MSGAGALGLIAVLVTATSGDLEATARATAEQSGKAVVTIRLVLKLKLGGQEHEQKMEVPGVVIDPSGLTVASASSIDPSGAIRRMVDAQRQRVTLESEVKETVILLEDGTELDAAVVLKDSDLDLAFIRPRDAGLKLSAVTVRPRSGTVPLLTRVFVLGRLGKLGSRALAVATGEVRAYVRGPAPYYVTDGETSSFVGSLAYTADGVPLGFLVKRFATSIDAQAGGRGSDSVMTVLRPVDKVVELAAQARNIAPAAPAAGALPEPPSK